VLTASRSAVLQRLAPLDWCVMDEAGQISQPAALGGMVLAKRHVLVGDQYQLPPLVVSLQAQVEVSVVVSYSIVCVCDVMYCIDVCFAMLCCFLLC
jgi:superfamily I DNA and/or RNA helicase